MTMNTSIGGAIILSRNYSISKMLDYKLNPSHTIFGNKNILIPTVNTFGSMYGRSDVITTFAEAEALTSKPGCRIYDIQMSPYPNQTGFDLVCSSQSVLSGAVVGGSAVAFKFSFCINMRVELCKAEGSARGYVSDILLGNNELSSNYILFLQCNAHNVTTIAFSNFYAYGSRFDMCESEGSVPYVADFYIEFDGKTTCNETQIIQPHIEHTRKHWRKFSKV